jgi:hypothetical protein
LYTSMRIPASVGLYAPGRLTSSLGAGAPVPEPVTVSWAQEG